MNGLLTSTARSPVFTQTVAPYLLLDDDLTIRGANDAYLSATQRDRDDLVGRFMFDAFPDNPADPSATGVRNLTTSLYAVLSRKSAHTMPIQRYDVAPTGTEVFVQKSWSPVNSPVTDDYGKAVGVLHHVEDITPLQALLDLYSWEGRGVTSKAAGTRTIHDRAMALAALRFKYRRDALARENRRLSDALVAMVASRGADLDAVARRRRLWRMVAELAADDRWAGWTNAVCAAAAGVLGTVEGAAVSLGATTTGERHLVAASDPWTAKAARLDQTILDAPTHEATICGAPVDVSDVSVECERWPAYAAAAAEIGLASVSAYPLVVDGLSLGVFTVYRRRAHMPGASETVDTAILADLAVSAVLADHSRVERELISDGGLGKHDVAVAAGMLCVERDLSFDEAILRLRGYAYAGGRGVRDVASDVVRHAVWII